jgi:exopolysaccharide biosynthesis polyprenyl glycosylphosphotransferase
MVGLAGHRPGPVLLAVAAPVVFALGGHYRARIAPSLYRQAASVAALVASITVAESALAGVPPGTTTRVAGLFALAVVSLRTASHAGIRRLRAGGRLAEGTLILGAGALGCEVARTLLEHPEYGLEPVGLLDGFEPSGAPVPVLGTVGQLDQILAHCDVRHVIIAFGATRDLDLVPVVRACDDRSVDVHVVPRFFELGVPIDGPDVDNVWGIPLQRLRRPVLQRHARVTKRAFDVLVSSLALALVSPVLVVLAVLVRRSSPGPIFFRQRRTGQRGQPIEVLKFRSMRVRDDADTRWVADDSVTPIGRVMRRTSLDELPQLINVLRGDMSLVGPRPERPFFVARFAEEVPRYQDRHRVPVGMTGWAQVHGLRGDTPIDQRARFDNQYVENWSLARDVAILFHTLWAVARDALG